MLSDDNGITNKISLTSCPGSGVLDNSNIYALSREISLATVAQGFSESTQNMQF